MEEECEHGSDRGEGEEGPEHGHGERWGAAEDERGKHGADADGRVEHGGGGGLGPVGGEAEGDTNEEIHDPVLAGELGLVLGVHEDDRGDAEGAHDLEEDRAEPEVLLHGGAEDLNVVAEPVEDTRTDRTQHLEEPEEKSQAEVESVGRGADHEGQGHGRVQVRARHTATHEATEPHGERHGDGAGAAALRVAMGVLREHLGGEPREGQDERREELKQDRAQVLAEGGHPFILSFIL